MICIDILHINFQEDHTNSKRFRGFPGGFLNSSRFQGFPGVVDTLSLLLYTQGAMAHYPIRIALCRPKLSALNILCCLFFREKLFRLGSTSSNWPSKSSAVRLIGILISSLLSVGDIIILRAVLLHF